MLYVGVIINIDPDGREVVVGAFSSHVARAQWACDSLPGIVRKLNAELGMGRQGIAVKPRFMHPSELPGDAISPDGLERIIRNIFYDVYATA